MARRGRRKKAGLMREDAARDAMRAFGLGERVIKLCIKELLELYEGEWFLIEEFSYSVLLNKCLEKQAEQENNVAEEEEEEEMAEEQHVEMAQEEDNNVAEEEEEMAGEQNVEMAQEEKEEVEEEQHVEDGRDHVGSNSTTAFVGCGAETGTQTCQTDALSISSKTEIMDSSPPSTFPSGEVEDYASPVAFQSSDYAHHSAGGAKRCGSPSDEEETDLDGDSVVVGDDDDEMIHLTPEPLYEELRELLREVRGEEKKRKRPTRWDT